MEGNLLRHWTKQWLPGALDASGLMRGLRRLGPNAGAVCLAYHRVEPSAFFRHARFLSREARVVGADEFLQGIPSSERPTVLLSFDDGYASFPEKIIPLLRQFHLPAVWFVPTEVVASARTFWFDRVQVAVTAMRGERLRLGRREWILKRWNRPYVVAAVQRFLKGLSPQERDQGLEALMNQAGPISDEALQPYRVASPEQMGAVDRRQVTVGSHSHTHTEMASLSPDRIREELTVSRRLLQEWTGHPVLDFALPSGEYNEGVLTAVKENGYRSAWTTEADWTAAGADPYRLPRMLMDDAASVGVLSAKITPFVSKRRPGRNRRR